MIKTILVLTIFLVGIISISNYLQPAYAVPVVFIGNGPNVPDGSYLNAGNLAITLAFTSVEIEADTEIVIVDDIDLSQSSFFGRTYYDLVLRAPTISINHNIQIGNGAIIIDSNTLNLDGLITWHDGTLVNQARLITRATTQVNVLSNAASLQQAVRTVGYLTNPATVQVSAGQYHENLDITRSVLLKGNAGTAEAGADSTAPEIFGTQAGGNVITVNVNNVMIYGLHLQAQVNGGSLTDSANGIYASGVSDLTISQNTLEGFCGLGISTPGSSGVTLDANLAIPTGTTEVPYNGVDEDCNGSDLTDVDGDTYASNQSVGGTPDCDDTNASIYPGATEVPYNGVDEDCNGSDLTDVDQDTYQSNASVGGTPDCDDTNASIYPGATEVPYNGVDEDCNGSDLNDVDGDTYASNQSVGGTPDCDDSNSAINPGATEIPNDGIDQDCNGSDLITTTPWTIIGYYNPVDMNGVLNTLKSGQAVPLKFEVFDGATEKTSTSDIASFTPTQISCSSFTTTIIDAVEITNTAGTSLKYDVSSGQFHANWKTPSGKANTCWEVKTTTTNGPSISAYFKLR